MTPDAATELKLEPCPFCGAVAIVYPSRHREWEVFCSGEDCTATITSRFSTEAAAIAAWNRRAPTAQPDVAGLMAKAEAWVEARLDVLRAANRIDPADYGYLQAHQRVRQADAICDAAHDAFRTALTAALSLPSPAASDATDQERAKDLVAACHKRYSEIKAFRDFDTDFVPMLEAAIASLCADVRRETESAESPAARTKRARAMMEEKDYGS